MKLTHLCLASHALGRVGKCPTGAACNRAATAAAAAPSAAPAVRSARSAVADRPQPGEGLATADCHYRRANDPMRSAGRPPAASIWTGYGAVFTAEMDLIVTPAICPFQPLSARNRRPSIAQRQAGQRLPLLEQTVQ